MSTSGYISVPVTTDGETIVQNSLTNIAAALPGWVPREGNLEVLLLEEFANMVAEAATVASDVPDTIFRYFGSLVGITPLAGTAAQIRATWTLINNAPSGGFTIPAGTIAGFYYQGAAYQFQTAIDVTISSGNKVATDVLMNAIEPSSAYNIYTFSNFTVNATYMQMLVADPNVASILITASHGSDSSLAEGVDPESDSAYQNRLAAELTLLAPRPITTGDYAALATNVSGVYRALAFDGFDPYTNLYATNDAYLNASTTVATWTPLGNGTNTPTIAVGASGLTLTAANVATGTTTYLTTTAPAGSTTLVVNTAIIGATVSATTPVFVRIADATNGDEVVAVTAIGGTGSKTWTLATPTQFAHTLGSGSTTIAPLQGVKTPNISNLYANQLYYQTAATVQIGTDITTGQTTGPATPYVVSIATYSDNTSLLYSNLYSNNSSLYSYSDASKVIFAKPISSNTSSTTALAPSNADATYSGIHPQITSIQNYVLWYNATSTKTHIIKHMACNMVGFDFGGAENPTLATSDYNWLPDSKLDSVAYANSNGATWVLDSGINALPGFGIQYVGTGSALAAAKYANSPVFRIASQYSTTFTAAVTVDTTNASSTYNKVVLEVLDKQATATSGTRTLLGSKAATFAGVQTLVVNLTLSAPKDIVVDVKFDTGLNVPLNSSILAYNAAVYYQTLSASQVQNINVMTGYSWTPGSQFIPNSFVASRSVSLAPVDVDGLYVGSSVAKTLDAYLESYREVNFDIRIATPNYVPINVSWAAVAQSGYTISDVQSRVNAALYNFLKPSTWAGGGNTPPYWDRTQTVVRVLDIAGIIASINGVSNVTFVTIGQYSPSGTTMGSTDITLGGIAPMPIANLVSGSVIASSSSSSLGGI